MLPHSLITSPTFSGRSLRVRSEGQCCLLHYSCRYTVVHDARHDQRQGDDCGEELRVHAYPRLQQMKVFCGWYTAVLSEIDER
jgi:hypothetical protein